MPDRSPGMNVTVGSYPFDQYQNDWAVPAHGDKGTSQGLAGEAPGGADGTETVSVGVVTFG